MPKKKGASIQEARELFIAGCGRIDHSRKKYCSGFLTWGIDPGRSSTGWAFKSPGEHETGVIAGNMIGFSKVMNVRKQLIIFLNAFTPKETSGPFVGIEDYAYNAKWGREKAGELGGVIRSVLYLRKRPLIAVSPLTVKAWIRAKKKEQIMLEILDKYGIKITSNDAADAFLIAEIVYHMLNMAADVIRYNVKASEVREYFKNEDYKRNKRLYKIHKYQANSLFNLIWGRGQDILFFK